MRSFRNQQRKAVAVHTLVLIIMMIFFTIFALFLFYKWTETTGIQTNAATCSMKKIIYCTDWRANSYGTVPWDWSTSNPKDCDAFEVTQPSKKEDCTGIG
jgi:hypothetical protein